MGILKFFWYSPSSGLIPHGSLCVDRHSGFYFDPMMTCDNMFSWGQGLGVQTLARLPNTGSCKFSCQFRRSSVARSWGSWLVYQTQGHSSSCVSSEDPVWQGLGVQTLARLPNTGSFKFLCQFRRSSDFVFSVSCILDTKISPKMQND